MPAAPTDIQAAAKATNSIQTEQHFLYCWPRRFASSVCHRARPPIKIDLQSGGGGTRLQLDGILLGGHWRGMVRYHADG
jgi:hypothetical protein